MDAGLKDLIKGKIVTSPNQVWVSDITYIRVEGGYAYGVFIMDVYSRKILSFEITNTMDEWMCVKALKKAMDKYRIPEIRNLPKKLCNKFS